MTTTTAKRSTGATCEAFEDHLKVVPKIDQGSEDCDPTEYVDYCCDPSDSVEEAKLNENRRARLRNARSLSHSSLQNFSEATSSQSSIGSSVNNGLHPRSLICVVINLISAGYILLPHGKYELHHTNSYSTLCINQPLLELE